MKKLFKALLVVACAGTLCAGAVALSACGGGDKEAEAYGLVHKAGYVGYTTVKIDKNDKVVDATLTEYCFPTQVKNGTDYYSEVTYGNVTMTYDVDAKTYKVGTQTLKEYFKSEANCKTYVEAVNEGKVEVTVDGAKKNDVMTKEALCKDYNGYGGTKFDWKLNRDATVKYVKENGFKNIFSLTLKDGKWVDSENVNSGASWTDMNTTVEGSLSYVELMVNAFNKVAKTPVTK